MTAALPRDPPRAALSALKQNTADIGSAPPAWERVLTIREHEGALDPSRPIVIGDRGTGKSFWTGVIFSLLMRFSRTGLSIQNI